ncbi:MAG: hypothetical protein ABI550_01695 [Ignavibacteriaceae bacterium]
MGFDDVKTFADLMVKFLEKIPGRSMEKTAEYIGISKRSFFDIKKGKEPKAKLTRVIKGYLEKEYKFNLEVVDKNKIKIKPLKSSNINRVQTNFQNKNNYENESGSKVIDLLTKKIEDIETSLTDVKVILQTLGDSLKRK